METVGKWRAGGVRAVVARPVSEHGLGARDAGQAMAISEEGATAGGLYGGVADAALRRGAEEVLAGGTPRLLDVSVTEPEAVAAGLVCGGHATVLLQPLPAIPPAWWEAIADPSGAALVTALDGGPGTSAVVRADDVQGSLGDPGLDAEAVPAARRVLSRSRGAREIREIAGRRVLIESVAAAPHLVVVGRGDLAGALDAQARLLGWAASVVDDPVAASALFAAHGRSACLVVLSHDPAIDTPVLAEALAAGIGYVGALGSRHTQAGRAERLRERGVPAEALAVIRGPVGLDLGARSPQETALAICAEILAVLGDRAPTPIRDTQGPINR
ncbi:XdhC family protein [Thermocatellispora tengchongensis]